MKIAFCADPLDGFKIYKDTTYAMMVESARRGHEVYAFEQKDMAIDGGVVVANIARISIVDINNAKDVDGGQARWYEASAPAAMPLHTLDAVVMRKDPPFDMQYLYATYLLERAQQQGARVFNRPDAVRNHNEKLAITEFPEFIAPTLVTSDALRIRAFHRAHHDIILKPLDGMGGAGVFRVRDDGMNLGAIIEGLTLNGRTTIMVQRYIPEIVHGDKRILLIGGTVVPFCLARIPQGGEVRGNLAAGGLGVAQPLSESDRRVAQILAPVLWARGLLLVGLDVIGKNLTEINVTSPTCFQEITQQTGVDVAALFVNALEKAV